MENRLCYHDLYLTEYHGLVKTIAENRRQELQVLFNPLIEKFGSKGWSLILVGSDGKQERHPQSKTEVVLLFKKKDHKADEMVRELKTLTSQSPDPIEFTEIKVLEDEQSPLSFYNGQPNQCFPDRVLNASFLLGEDDIFIQSRRQVLSEMSEESELGKKVRKELKEQLTSYKNALISGQYRGQIIFDENNQYYFETDDWKRARMGFKMGPLRAVQRKLDILTLNAIKQGNLTIDDVAENCPSNTCERIDFLAKKGILDENQVEIIIEAYLWFLREYHRAQELFKDSSRQEVISCSFYQEEFKQYRQVLLDFLNLSPKLSQKKS